MAKQLSVDLTLNALGFKQGIDEAKKGTEQYTNAVKLSDNNIKDLNRAMKQSQQEAKALAIAFNSLSEAEKNSVQGQALKRSLDESIQRAAQLKDTVSDTMAEIKARSSDTAGLDAFKQALDIGKSVATAYAGALGKLTGDEKAMKDMIANITIIQGSFNTAISIGTALQKQSAIMTNIANIQRKSATLAIKAETSATKGATVAQRAFNAVAKANPYVLIASVMLAAAAAITTYMLATKKSREEDEKAAKEKERLAAVQKAYTDKLTSTATNLVTSYSKLQAQWKSLKTDMEKNQFIKQNASEFDKLGISVKNISDAEKAFVTNTSAVVASMMKRAQAAALEAKAEQLVASSLEKAEQIRTRTAQYEADKKEAENIGDELIDVNGTVLKSDKKRKDALNKLREDYAKDLRDLTQGMMQDRANAQKLYEKAVQINPPKFDDKGDKQNETAEKIAGKIVPRPDKLGIAIDKKFQELTKTINEKAKADLQKLIDPDAFKPVKDVDLFVNDFFKEQKFDFSALPQAMQDAADESLAQLDRIKEGFKQFADDPKALEKLLEMYDEVINKLKEWEEQNKKLVKHQAKLSKASDIIEQAGQAFSSLGSAFDVKELNAAGIMASAIATMIESYSKAMTMAAELGPFAWLAFGLTGITQLGAIISQMKSLYGGSYAQGGVVSGNSYNGDRLWIRANSGERVLTAEQNRNLEEIAKTKNYYNNNNNLKITSVRVSGSDLLLAINNDRQIHGKAKL